MCALAATTFAKPPHPLPPQAQAAPGQQQAQAAPGHARGGHGRGGKGRAGASGQAKRAPSTGASTAPTSGSPAPSASFRAISARRTPPGQARKAPATIPTFTTTTTTSAAPARARKARKAGSAARSRSIAARRKAAAAQAHTVAAARRAAAQSRAAALRRGPFAPIATAAAAAAAPAAAASAAPHRAATSGKPVSHPDRNPVTVVTRTVRDIAHVIPGWAKALMAALAVLLTVAALLILAGALRNRRLRAQRAALLEDVGALQAALLPTVPQELGGLAVSVAYRPAEGLAAGGDFYDVFPLDRGRVGFLVGDVSGHGRESLRSATFTRHMVRSYLEAGLGPRAALQLAGKVVDEHDRDEFATLIAAIHDPDAGTLSYASAGHPPPIVTGPAAHEPMIAASAPPIGVGSPTGLRQTTVPFPPGSAVFLFTDGLFEARCGHSIIGRSRLEEIVHELGPAATASQIVERVERESDSIRDDVAACLVRVDGGAATSGTVRVEELEVDADEFHLSRVRRFLDACGVAPAERESVIQTASRRVAADGPVLLRVRLADNRSGVDVLPTTSAEAGAPVTALTAARAG